MKHLRLAVEKKSNDPSIAFYPENPLSLRTNYRALSLFFLQNQIQYENFHDNLYQYTVPNAGHEMGDGIEKAWGKTQFFYHSVAKKNILPKISWIRRQNNSTGTITVKIENGVPSSINAWHADTENREKRE